MNTKKKVMSTKNIRKKYWVNFEKKLVATKGKNELIKYCQITHQSLLDAMEKASPPDCEEMMAEIERGLYMTSDDDGNFEVREELRVKNGYFFRNSKIFLKFSSNLVEMLPEFIVHLLEVTWTGKMNQLERKQNEKISGRTP